MNVWLQVVQAVHLINPANLSVMKTITRDQDGNTLSNVGAEGGGFNISRSWNDVVLARVGPAICIHYILRTNALVLVHKSTAAGPQPQQVLPAGERRGCIPRAWSQHSLVCDHH